MNDAKESIRICTCSWNYDSWMGLVYSRKAPYSAAYLAEYAQKYSTVEVDSWFYKIPTEGDAHEYKSQVPPDFNFCCKLSESLSLTHARNRDKKAALIPNDTLLSPELYAQYADAIRILQPQIFLLELEFEYLNKQKMESVDAFLRHLEGFVTSIDRSIPLGIEIRNGNYLTRDYFQFLKDHDIVHVFSEKIYMPHVYEVYEKFGDLLSERTAVRLLGGDRKEIEAKTKGNWNEIVDEKSDLPIVIDMLKDLSKGERRIQLYVNNHYEGSAPLTIEKIKGML